MKQVLIVTQNQETGEMRKVNGSIKGLFSKYVSLSDLTELAFLYLSASVCSYFSKKEAQHHFSAVMSTFPPHKFNSIITKSCTYRISSTHKSIENAHAVGILHIVGLNPGGYSDRTEWN